MPARPVYAIFRRDDDPHIPMARFRVDGAARAYAVAVENVGTPIVVLHRDEDPELGEPSAWTEVYRTPAARA